MSAAEVVALLVVDEVPGCATAHAGGRAVELLGGMRMTNDVFGRL